MIFLIDGDNNITTDLNGIEVLNKDDSVMIFHKKGLDLTKLKKRTATTKAAVQFIESVKAGKNSLDFQIVSELGVLIGEKKVDQAYIISQDKGYEAAIKSLKKRYPDSFKDIALKESIEECLSLPFILKAKSKLELSNALNREYGTGQGTQLYNHLKALFNGTVVDKTAATVTSEKK